MNNSHEWHRAAIDEICQELPGGQICDPQQVADMLRTHGLNILAKHDPQRTEFVLDRPKNKAVEL